MFLFFWLWYWLRQVQPNKYWKAFCHHLYVWPGAWIIVFSLTILMFYLYFVTSMNNAVPLVHITLQELKHEHEKIFPVAFSIVMISLGAEAQRYVVIDSKIHSWKMPEYKDAQTKHWPIQPVVAAGNRPEAGCFDKMYKDFDAEQVMLPDALKKAWRRTVQ